MKPTIVLAASLLILLTINEVAGQGKIARGTSIMITAHPDAAKAGYAVWKRGGNVVDVAVATAYCLGVVEPHGSGIGGEGMMLIYSASTGKTTVIDFKAISPSGATYGTLDYSKVGSWARSAKAASVPGVVAGLELAREQFGKLDRAAVMQPAIDLAVKGFQVDSTLALNLSSYQRILMRDSYAASIYYPGGVARGRGVRVTNPQYGRTLQVLQKEGAEAFYRGSIAAQIVQDAKTQGAFIAAGDLSAYRPVVREPLQGQYRGYTLVTTPPPCGGMFLIEGLSILENFDLRAMRRLGGYDAHLLAEVFKLIYKDERTFNADPDFRSVPVDSLLSAAVVLGRLRAVSLQSSTPPARLRSDRVTQPNTTQLCVVDGKGNAVTMTLTLSSLFGTAHTVEGAGFFLNNEMQNFDENPLHPNGLAPHKRVVTSLIPTLVLKDGRLVGATGTPGGDLIISTIIQVLVNLIDHASSPWEAVDAPRLFSIHLQDELELEGRFDPETEALLRRMGHIVEVDPPYQSYYGAVQLIWRDPGAGALTGVSDSRRSGAAVGE